MNGHHPDPQAFQYPTSDHCPRCLNPLHADRSEARRCKACGYGRAEPSHLSKKVAIYGWGAFELLHPRIDWLLQNVMIRCVIGAPRMALPERYARYREVNFHEYSGGPRMMLNRAQVDLVICVGPSEYLEQAKVSEVPFRFLNGRTGQAASALMSAAAAVPGKP